jgi:hypothetical protein
MIMNNVLTVRYFEVWTDCDSLDHVVEGVHIEARLGLYFE